jgi:integral membrane protein
VLGKRQENPRSVSLLRVFRLVGALEAASYLLLLLIAMPLKYVWDMPIYVRWTGTIHGALFVLFCILVAVVAYARRWPLRTASLAFVSAFLPFGPLLFDHYFLPTDAESAQ